VKKKLLSSSLLSIVLLCTAWGRPGRIDQVTTKMREDILRRVRFVEVQRLLPGTGQAGSYNVHSIAAKLELDEAASRDLIARFRSLPFERVTIAQCHEPGFALRLLDSDRNHVATISLCWKCHNLQATPDSPQEFHEYKEDFAADSKRGLSFQRRLDRLVPKPPESPNQAMERTATRRAFASCVTTNPSLRSTRAPGGRRSSFSR
jgi:hypothetical protein